MPHLRSVAVRLVAAVALSLGAGFALSGAASAAPVPVAPEPAGIVCPVYAEATTAIVRPCFPPCPVYSLDAAPARIIRPCPPCPIYALDGVQNYRWCPPPCPIYLTTAGAGLSVWCPPPPPPCPYLTAPTTDQLVYCPLPER